MQPRSEMVHWMFAIGFLILGLSLLTEAIVGAEVWRARAWRAYLWPSFLFGMGVLMWPVMVFFTNSTIHTLAHGAWADTMMVAGAAELGLVRGKLTSGLWKLAVPVAFAVSAAAILVHEQNGWYFQRSSFLHHAIGWVVLIGAIFPLGRALRRRSIVFESGFALTLIVVAFLLFCDRDTAPVFGHLSPIAGIEHR